MYYYNLRGLLPAKPQPATIHRLSAFHPLNPPQGRQLTIYQFSTYNYIHICTMIASEGHSRLPATGYRPPPFRIPPP